MPSASLISAIRICDWFISSLARSLRTNFSNSNGWKSVMAEILGLGVSHYPPLSGLDEDMANAHRGRLNDPDIPDTAKDPNTWSELAQREWADPVAAAAS
jgi:hypothetical protein